MGELTASEEFVPYFLISRARGDDDTYVEEFFDDLCREVSELTGTAGRGDIGVLADDCGADSAVDVVSYVASSQ